MEIVIKQNHGQVTVFLKGHMDSAAAAEVKNELSKRLVLCGLINRLTCDARELTYISSSGLRIMLQLSKSYPHFSIIEVQPDVYNVFDVTGFTKIMTIERALRQITVNEKDVIGSGGVGTVYRISDDTIIKVFREGTTIDQVQNEIAMAKEAFVLGMPTAISFDVVRVGNQYGLVYELLNAETLSTCVKQHPDNIDEYARKYASLFRQMHRIHVPQHSTIPDAMAREEAAVRHISRYFDTRSVDLMLQMICSIPPCDRLLHCDLQSKNAMMQGNELMLIDMGEVGFGHPLLDLGHAYSAMVTLVGDYDHIIGMPRDYGKLLWEKMIAYYFEGCTPAVIDHRNAQIDVVSTVRNFSWLALSDSFPEKVIRECQELFDERIYKRRDYLLAISRTFSDWTL